MTSFAAALPPYYRDTVAAWLKDDCPSLDVGGLVVGDAETTATLWCKSSGVLAGVPFFDATFAALGGCAVTWLVEEGAFPRSFAGAESRRSRFRDRRERG